MKATTGLMSEVRLNDQKTGRAVKGRIVRQIAVYRAARAASQFVPKRCTKFKMISRYDKLCFESGGYVGLLPDYQSRICLPGHPGKLKFEQRMIG